MELSKSIVQPSKGRHIPASHHRQGVRDLRSPNELHLRRVREAKCNRLPELDLDQCKQRRDPPFGRCHCRPGYCGWLGFPWPSSPTLGIHRPKASKKGYHGRSQDWWCHCRVKEIHRPKASKNGYHGCSQDWRCHCRVEEHRLFDPI